MAICVLVSVNTPPRDVAHCGPEVWRAHWSCLEVPMPPDGVTYGLAWIDAVILLLLALLITGLVLGYVSEVRLKKQQEAPPPAEQPDRDTPEQPRHAA